MTKLTTPTDSFVVVYPEPIEFAEKQTSVFWMHNEVKVEKDVHDVITNLTEAERHGVITTLKLFTKYEMIAGDEYWTGRFAAEFPRHEFARMAATFGFFELQVHMPFYNKINELLHLNTDEFYTDYINDPVLNERMDFIDSVVGNRNPLVSLGAFSFVEGAVLYSSFAFLKHFQSQGKNKLTNIVRGINFSVRDENIHALAGAWCFRKLAEELDVDVQTYKDEFYKLADIVLQHEKHIIAKIFEKGPITGITAHQMEEFVKSRLNECLKNLGFDKLYEVKYNPIAEWFYDGITGYSFNDFFSGIGNQYHRVWDETAFTWND